MRVTEDDEDGNEVVEEEEKEEEEGEAAEAEAKVAERESSSMDPSRRAAVHPTPNSTLSQPYSNCSTDRECSALDTSVLTSNLTLTRDGPEEEGSVLFPSVGAVGLIRLVGCEG